jgi:8-oxo-dGTP pyrophosphatase MutT (NUDIX family)
VLDSDVDGVRCRVRWPGGRTTTAYPWHITVLPDQIHVHDTVELVVLRAGADGQLQVLLIQRRWDPYAGCWVLPGGHVDPGETARQAGVRELAEETGIQLAADELVEIGTFDEPDRDPRGPLHHHRLRRGDRRRG